MVKQKESSTSSLKKALPWVKNRSRKLQMMLQLKFELKKQKKQERLQRKQDRASKGLPPLKPRTIESMREAEDSLVTEDNPEVKIDESLDEFSKYYSGEVSPKVLLTTKKNSSPKLISFCNDLIGVIPNLEYYDRQQFTVSEIIEFAKNRNFTDLLIFSERLKKPDGLCMVHLPDGPTAHFRVSNCWKRKEIPNHGNPTGYNPELILQGFDTRLGQRIARMFMALFPQRPEFRGRCVVTLKNQRDFLFFRHHRYLFKDEGRKVILQEVGPRMTLKLRRLEQGTFQGKHAKQEFLYQPNMQVSRKKFFL